MSDATNKKHLVKASIHDRFSIDGHIVEIIGADSQGLAVIVSRDGKNFKRKYAKLTRPLRMSPAVDLTVKHISTNYRNFEIVISQPQRSIFKQVNGSLSRLSINRRVNDQVYLITDSDRAIVTLISTNKTHAVLKVEPKNGPTTEIKVSRREVVRVWHSVFFLLRTSVDDDHAYLQVLAPKHVRVDRHEVYIRREHASANCSMLRPLKKPKGVKEEVSPYRKAKAKAKAKAYA